MRLGTNPTHSGHKQHHTQPHTVLRSHIYICMHSVLSATHSAHSLCIQCSEPHTVPRFPMHSVLCATHSALPPSHALSDRSHTQCIAPCALSDQSLAECWSFTAFTQCPAVCSERHGCVCRACCACCVCVPSHVVYVVCLGMCVWVTSMSVRHSTVPALGLVCTNIATP